MLELRLDEGAKVYAAPLQMKANNGMLVIDDFGRQVMSPRKLLNRWIVPLDRREDYLNLRYGVKFRIPFELMVVFSTNLDPRRLADEAFLRRIHSKVYVEPVSEEVFDEIFRRYVENLGLTFDPEHPRYLRQLCRDMGYPQLRACYPADVCSILQWMSDYKGEPLAITPAGLRQAANLYFAQDKSVQYAGEE